jgi:hypothetical protein
MISLSATTYDVTGRLILPARAIDPYQAQRRGSVTATLDGESAVYDTGYSVSDITLTVRYRRPSRAQIITLQYLIAYYSELILCCESGAFMARPRFTISNDTLNLQLRLLRRLDS